jgi:hypothetical protein
VGQTVKKQQYGSGLSPRRRVSFLFIFDLFFIFSLSFFIFLHLFFSFVGDEMLGSCFAVYRLEVDRYLCLIGRVHILQPTPENKLKNKQK